MKLKEILQETLEWTWFIITLPYIMIFTDKMLGGAGGLESEFEYNMFDNMKFSTTGKISYIFIKG
jgi:hypothetical protein